MKKTILLISIFNVCIISNAQKLIDRNTTLKPGIYKSFDEFKYNNPSMQLNCKVLARLRGNNNMNKQAEVIYYRLDFDSSNKQKSDNIFGFCDGKNIYINEHYPGQERNPLFIKISYIGKYCLYDDRICTTIYGDYHSRIKCVPVTKLINLETGEIIILNKNSLKEIIKNDKPLLDRFNKEVNKNKKLKKYIIQYLERNSIV